MYTALSDQAILGYTVPALSVRTTTVFSVIFNLGSYGDESLVRTNRREGKIGHADEHFVYRSTRNRVFATHS